MPRGTTRTARARRRAPERAKRPDTSARRPAPRTEPPSQPAGDRARPRAFWSGTITFGLVGVPVDLYPAAREERPRLRMLDADGTPLRRLYWCPKEDRALDADEIVRGVEVDGGKWVTVTDEELEALEPRKSRDIELKRFVPRDDLPPAHLETGYVLAPSGPSPRAYRLLAAAMEETGRAGIATFVLREREHVVAILADSGVLRAQTLRFADEVRTPEQVGLPRRPEKLPSAALRAAEGAVATSRARSLPADWLASPENDALARLVRQKLRRHEDVAETEAIGEEEADEPVDLMAYLKERMAEPGKAGARRR